MIKNITSIEEGWREVAQTLGNNLFSCSCLNRVRQNKSSHLWREKLRVELVYELLLIAEHLQALGAGVESDQVRELSMLTAECDLCSEQAIESLHRKHREYNVEARNLSLTLRGLREIRSLRLQ